MQRLAGASLWMGVDLIGILMLYRGLQVGKASVVAPIASSFSVVTVLLAVGSGERFPAPVFLGIGFTLAGVILTTIEWTGRTAADQPRGKIAQGAAWAVLASLTLGTAFFGLRYPSEAIGGIATAWIGRVQASVVLPPLMLLLRRPPSWPGRREAARLLAVGLFDAIALVSYNIGLGMEHTSVVITAVSLFAVVTMGWGVIAGRETANWNQWLGIGCTFVGIALIVLNE
ncbi:DMT family transporter [Paenibacillus sp. P25]|nr:DMT family transporter [Paenibacillus sp. P25]